MTASLEMQNMKMEQLRNLYAVGCGKSMPSGERKRKKKREFSSILADNPKVPSGGRDLLFRGLTF
jgi:hypothetical protein